MEMIIYAAAMDNTITAVFLSAGYLLFQLRQPPCPVTCCFNCGSRLVLQYPPPAAADRKMMMTYLPNVY